MFENNSLSVILNLCFKILILNSSKRLFTISLSSSVYFVQLTISWAKRLHPLQTSSPKVVEHIPKQGVEDQEVAVNGIEKTEESDVTLAGDPKETSEIKNSISNDQEAENKKLSGDDDANTAIPKRKRSPRKKTVVSKDNEQGSEASDTKEPSTAPELGENDEGGDALKVKSKPRTRKKVIKETDTKDAGHSLNSGSISEG